MFKKLSAPIVLQWEVTPSCNHRCIHCYNYWRKGPRLTKLYQGYQKIYQAAVDEIISSNIFTVVVTGGEPMLVLDQVLPYITQLVNCGVKVTMNTNLTLLTNKKAAKLKAAGISSFLVSIPSGDPVHCDQITNSKGSLSRIIRGIKVAQTWGFPVFTNMVVSKINFDDVDTTGRLVASLGLNNFAATRASKPVKDGWFADEVLNLDEFRIMLGRLYGLGEELGIKTDSLEANPACAFGSEYISKVRRYCTAGKTTATIGFDGAVRPCNRLPLSYGNIVDGFKPAWDAMEDTRSNAWIPAECGQCKLKDRCAGGCKADALIEYGTLNKADPLCDLSYLPTVPYKPFPIVSANEFKMNLTAKRRVEDFGAIIYVNIANWVPVTITLADYLFSGQTITIPGLSSSLSCSDDKARMTASFLVSKKILSEI